MCRLSVLLTLFVRQMWLVLCADRAPHLRVKIDVVNHDSLYGMMQEDDPSSTELWKAIVAADLVISDCYGQIRFVFHLQSLSLTQPLIRSFAAGIK